MSSARPLLVLAALAACAHAIPSLSERSSSPCSAEVQEPCLRCACSDLSSMSGMSGMGGALLCSHRACAPLPTLTAGCRVINHPGVCCPHVYCPGEVVIDTEIDAESDDHTGLLSVSNNSLAHACHEDGRTYVSGSAMSGGAACAQCYCVHGVRRCVAPRCLPPPPRCTPRPAPGLCCPQHYRCTHPHPDATPAPNKRAYECLVEGRVVAEGTRVAGTTPCAQCFCLRAQVRCGPLLACARALPGCAPVMAPGHCCALRYNCTHSHAEESELNDGLELSHNSLSDIIDDKDRSFRLVESSENTVPPENDERANKVKRKTDEAIADASPATTTTQPPSDATTTAEPNTETSTVPDQIEGSIKIAINGTINCTTSISSSDVPMNSSAGNEQGTSNQSKSALEVDDIITEREPESFTVRVTSALVHAPPPASAPAAPSAPAHNASEDYDYDYVEPTLPPSLPNLKIIPFVAADAVVDKEDSQLKDHFPKEHDESLPSLDREDKFPVYFAPAPAPPALTTAHAQRRQDAPPAPRPSITPPRKPTGSLFSPPMETEGGFVPKAPGLADEYFPLYSPRPAPSLLLTTSMQLGTVKDDVISLTTPRPQLTTTSTTTTELPTTMRTDDETSPVPLSSPATSELPASKAQTSSTASVSTTIVTEAATTVSAATQATILLSTTTTTIPPPSLPTPPDNSSLEYEEEDEDEGFSFGNVLKLLLSESYDTPPRTTTPPPPPPPKPTVAPFVPLPPRPLPPRKTASPHGSGVNRIDHLVLGEATAIRRPAPPTVVTRRPPPPPTRRPEPLAPPTAPRRPPPPPTRRPEPSTTRRAPQTSTPPPPPVPPLDTGGPVPAGLKLAGCNIYGRMYRVGRIIAELSSACQECRCTDTGVQCRPLTC